MLHVEREHTVNQVRNSFSKGGKQATLTSESCVEAGTESIIKQATETNELLGIEVA